MPNFRKSKNPALPQRSSIYDGIIEAAYGLRLDEWLEIDSADYTSPEHGRLCVRQALNRSARLDAIRDRKVFEVRLLANENIGIKAVRPK